MKKQNNNNNIFLVVIVILCVVVYKLIYYLRNKNRIDYEIKETTTNEAINTIKNTLTNQLQDLKAVYKGEKKFFGN